MFSSGRLSIFTLNIDDREPDTPHGMGFNVYEPLRLAGRMYRYVRWMFLL